MDFLAFMGVWIGLGLVALGFTRAAALSNHR